MTWTPTEPTADQCDRNDPVPGPYPFPAYALWYPQMGGYASKCVAVPEDSPPLDEDEETDPCWTVHVWHDGDFPFHPENGDTRPSTELHHCSAQQFIDFGNQLMACRTPHRRNT